MASAKDLKKRISSVKNTQQTTRAMKMVSAAKLRRAQEAIQNHRPYAKRIDSMIRQVAALVDDPFANPLVATERVSTPGTKKDVLLVLVTSDRGLCGAFNSNVIKTAARWVSLNQEKFGKIELAFLGKKAYDFYKTKAYTLGTYWQDCGGRVSFPKARKMVDEIIVEYLAGKYDEVKFIYNEFKNVVTQRVVVENFLPLNEEVMEDIPGEPLMTVKHDQPAAEQFIVKPELDQLLHDLLAKHFVIQAFRIMLESQAGEHGARMSAMENATKNASEMIRKLTLIYNKTRQAGITKELLEIVGGSEAQKS